MPEPHCSHIPEHHPDDGIRKKYFFGKK